MNKLIIWLVTLSVGGLQPFLLRHAAIVNPVRAIRIRRTKPSAARVPLVFLPSSTLHLAAPWYARGESTQPLPVCVQNLPPQPQQVTWSYSAVVAHSRGLADYTSCTQPACS